MNKQKIYALVTGASSGIGWHISKELALRGYSIVAVSNQANQLQALKSELEKDYEINVETIDCDLSDINAAHSIFNFCEGKKLQVEVLVNNAGILVYGEVVGVEFEKMKTILQLHVNTPVMLCRLFGASMMRNKKGYILNVSSISAVMPFPTISLYGPTKTFLRKFSRAFRTEMKGSGIELTCLLPGATATALHNPKKVNIPLAMKLGVMKKAEDVAKAGVRAMFKKRAECVPGLLNKLTLLFVPIIPHVLIRLIYRKMNREIILNPE